MNELLTIIEIKKYLFRLGISDIQPPTKSFLFDLHRAHVAKIPWQSLDAFAGKPGSIDPLHSVKLILQNRSGYCFHLNGAFYTLLRSLGYRVAIHPAGVQAHAKEPRIDHFHLGLMVSLPESDRESWLVDVGLGDMPYEPLLLSAGVYEQGPFTYALKRSMVDPGGWRLDNHPAAPYAGVDYHSAAITSMEPFQANHDYLSTNPESTWVNMLLIRNRTANVSSELRGCIFSQTDRHGTVKIEITDKARWLEIMGDVFGEHLVQYDSAEKDGIWKKLAASHEEWKKTMKS